MRTNTVINFRDGVIPEYLNDSQTGEPRKTIVYENPHVAVCDWLEHQ